MFGRTNAGSSGGGNGGSAEYQYVNDISEVTYPKKTMTADEWRASPMWFKGDLEGFKNSTADFSIYVENSNYNDIANLFDNDINTSANQYDTKYGFRFSSPVKMKQIAYRIYNTLYVENVKIYGTDNPANFGNIKAMELVGDTKTKDNSKMIYFDLNPTKPFQYYTVAMSGVGGRNYVAEMKFVILEGTTRLALKSANMTPAIDYNVEPAEITTQPFYDGANIVDSKKLLFKPYAEGGALVDYVDDKEPVNLGLYLMHPDGVTMFYSDYNNFEVNGKPDINPKTGVFHNPAYPNNIELPTFTSNNFEIAVKCMLTDVTGDQGRLLFNLSKTRDLIYVSNSKFSTYINGGTVEGITVIEPNSIYWLKIIGSSGNVKCYLAQSDAPECPATESMNLEFDTAMPNISDNKFTLGSGYSGQKFSGDIYLEGAYVKVDGVEVWTPRTEKLSDEYIYLLAQNDFVPPAGFDNKTLVSTLNLPDRTVLLPPIELS